MPALVACISFRLELLHRVNYMQQCAHPGIEVWSPSHVVELPC